MFVNNSALRCTGNFRVVVDELDVSDHRPIACTVQLGAEGDVLLQDKGKCNKLHKFNWKNLDFAEVYADCLEELLWRNCLSSTQHLRMMLEHVLTSCMME